MTVFLFIELVMSFIVFCSDSIPDAVRTPTERTLRALLWPVTLYQWFTHSNWPKLIRFSSIVWFFVISGWLLSLEWDRLGHILPLQLTMSFVIWVVDQMNADLLNSPLRRAARAIVWPYPLTSYMVNEDGIKLQHSILIVWGFLTTGWMLTLGLDRLL